MGVQQVADLVSPLQERAPPRRNDLSGTLADTCRAKKLLHFSARYDFIDTMRAMIAHASVGGGDYLAAMWEQPSVVEALERHTAGWSTATTQDRAARLKDLLRGNPAFLEGLLRDV